MPEGRGRHRFSRHPTPCAAVAVRDTTTACAAGKYGTLARTTDGSTWELVGNELANDIFDLEMLDSANGWAVGPPASVLRTSNGGLNWTAVTDVGDDDLRAIQPIDDDNLVSCGSYTFIASVDGGDTWQERYTYMNCWSLHFFDELNGLAGTQHGVFRTSDGGMNWNFDGYGLGSGGIFDFHFLTPNHGFAAAGIEHIYETLDGGLTWALVHESPPPNVYLRAITFVDAESWLGGGRRWAYPGHRRRWVDMGRTDKRGRCQPLRRPLLESTPGFRCGPGRNHRRHRRRGCDLAADRQPDRCDSLHHLRLSARMSAGSAAHGEPCSDLRTDLRRWLRVGRRFGMVNGGAVARGSRVGAVTLRQKAFGFRGGGFRSQGGLEIPRGPWRIRISGNVRRDTERRGDADLSAHISGRYRSPHHPFRCRTVRFASAVPVLFLASAW